MITRGINSASWLQPEGEVSSILSNFNTDFVYNVIQDLMQRRSENFNLIAIPNFVDELEISFKDMMNTYPSDEQNIKESRNDIYTEIIRIISSNTGIIFNYDETTDMYTLARTLFDLFISNYDNYVFRFLYNFIYTQKDFIYNELNLERNRKSKDISTIYNKQAYMDQHLAIINANLNICLSFISNLDFNVPNTLGYIYTTGQEIHTMNFLLSHIDQEADLFDILIKPLILNPVLSPSLSTCLKLEIQKNCIPDTGINTNLLNNAI